MQLLFSVVDHLLPACWAAFAAAAKVFSDSGAMLVAFTSNTEYMCMYEQPQDCIATCDIEKKRLHLPA